MNATYSRVRSPESTKNTTGAEALVRTLRRSNLFASVPAPELRTILAMGQERYIPKQAIIFSQGDRADNIYVLVQGKVKLLLIGSSGRSIILAIVEPGEAFGHVALMAGTAQTTTAQAIQASRVLVWPAVTFEKILTRYSAVARNTLRITARQLQADRGRLYDLATEPVSRRLARTILRLARPAGRRRTSTLAMMHQDLAELLGTTPPTLSRILGRWEARGLVTARRELVTITQPEDLATIAEPDEPIGRAIPRRSKRWPAKS